MHANPMKEPLMPKIWSARYSLNHPKLDEQHKELYCLANHVEELNPHTTTKEDQKAKKLNEEITKLRNKYGIDIIRSCIEKYS